MLLEREREIATLDEFVSGAGRPGAASWADRGTGRDRQDQPARRGSPDAESDGIRVLTARGSTIEAEFPYGVVRQLFEPALADPQVRERAFEGAAQAARAVFEVSATGEDTEAVGFATLHGLYWMTLNLAGEEPLLLAIDDLHWVDHPSLRFIAYLVRRLEVLPVIVISGVRPNEPGADAEMIAEIAADPLTANVHRRPDRRTAWRGTRRGLHRRLARGHRREPVAALRAPARACCRGRRAARRPARRRFRSRPAGRLARRAAARPLRFRRTWAAVSR